MNLSSRGDEGDDDVYDFGSDGDMRWAKFQPALAVPPPRWHSVDADDGGIQSGDDDSGVAGSSFALTSSMGSECFPWAVILMGAWRGLVEVSLAVRDSEARIECDDRASNSSLHASGFARPHFPGYNDETT